MTVCLLIAIFTSFFETFNKQDFHPSMNFHYGVEENGVLNTVTMSKPFDQKKSRSTLWQLDLSRASKASQYDIDYLFSPPFDIYALRWTINKSVAYADSYPELDVLAGPIWQFRMEDLSLLDRANMRGRELLAKKYKLDLAELGNDRITPDEFGFHQANNRTQFFLEVVRGRVGEVHRSFWVSPDGLVSEFVIANKTLHVGIATTVSPGRNKPVMPHLTAKREIKADFQEPFLVFADMQRHYFVTRSGMVYQCPRLDLCSEWPQKLGKYHVETDMPVRTIITSPAHMRTFIAGPISPDGTKFFWRELCWKGNAISAPQPYSPDKTSNYPKAIETISQFAKFLNDKKLFSMPD